MTGEWAPISVEEFIRRLIADGWRDDEILDRFTAAVALDGRILHPYNPSDRRKYLAAVQTIRGNSPLGFGVPADNGLALPADILSAYRELQSEGVKRPGLTRLRERLGYDSDDGLRKRLHKLGIRPYALVHELAAQAR